MGAIFENPEIESQSGNLKKPAEDWQKAFHPSGKVKPRKRPPRFPKPLKPHKITIMPSKPWMTLPGYWQRRKSVAKIKKRSTSQHWPLIDTLGISKDHINEAHTKPRIIVRKELIEGLIKEAESGNADAQYAIAECYRLGVAFPIHPNKAFHYCQLAANQGCSDAQMMLGRFFEDGFGVTQSFKDAYNCYQLASDQANQTAKKYLKLCCEIEMDYQSIGEDVFHWYQVNVDEDDPLKTDFFDNLFFHDISTATAEKLGSFNNEKFFALAKAMANEGDVTMQLFVALCYAVGRYESPSKGKCYEYLTLAAENNSDEACRLLGLYFISHKDDTVREKALYYLRRSAKQGNATSRLLLGQLFLEQNELDKAMKLFELVDSECDIDYLQASSHYFIGECFEKGYGSETSQLDAIKFYTIAAGEGNHQAQYRLAKAFFNSELGLSKNLGKSINYYELAAEQDNEEALLFLAKAYHQGLGVKQSDDKAYYYLRKSTYFELEHI